MQMCKMVCLHIAGSSSLVNSTKQKTYVVGTQNNRLHETVLLSTQNIIMLKLMGKKIFTILCSKFFVYPNLWLFVKYQNRFHKFISNADNPN